MRQQVEAFLAVHDPATADRLEFLRARFDAGLAWVGYPKGLGGQGLSPTLQPEVDRLFEEAGAPSNHPTSNGIGLGMAAPTILACGTDEQKQRFLRPLWTKKAKADQIAFGTAGAHRAALAGIVDLKVAAQ